MTWFPPFDEGPLFAYVQAEVEKMTDALFEEVLANVVVAPEHEARAREIVQSRRAVVELAGLHGFDRQRRLHGDETTLDWRDHARHRMIVALLDLFPPPEGGGGDRDGSGDHPLGPLGPLNGLCLPGGDRSAHAVGSRPPRPRRGVRYVATRTELAEVARGLARAHTRRVIGWWTADSEAVAHVEQEAAAVGMNRCERLWDPERGSLLGYLSTCVRSVVLEEMRNLSIAKERDAERLEGLKSAETERARLVSGRDPADADAELVDRGRTFLAWALPQLSDRQRDEIERRLRDETPGTNADQTAYRRALQALERLYDEWSGPGETA